MMKRKGAEGRRRNRVVREGRKGDPRCASYICARRAQRDSEPPGIRPRDKCVLRRETKRVTTRRHSLSRFQAGTGDRKGGGPRLRPMKSPARDTTFCIPSSGPCHYSRGVRVAKDIPLGSPSEICRRGSRSETRAVDRIHLTVAVESQNPAEFHSDLK